MYHCIILYELIGCKPLNSTLLVYLYMNLFMYELTSIPCDSYHTTSNKFTEVQTVFAGGVRGMARLKTTGSKTVLIKQIRSQSRKVTMFRV